MQETNESSLDCSACGPAEIDSAKLAPHIFVRSAGLNPGTSMLSDHSALRSLEFLKIAQASAKEAVGEACAILEAAVPAAFEDSNEIGRGLIRAKRDLFNGRQLPLEKHRQELAWLSPAARETVMKADRRVAALKAAQSEFEERHRLESRQTREAALRNTTDKLFLAGLAVTNPSLYDLLIEVRSGKRSLSEKDYNQVSATLMRYLLRASRKTSPIATFGPVWTAKLSETGGPASGIQVPHEIRCTRTVRGALIQRELQRLLGNWFKLSSNASIQLNPTFQVTEDGVSEWWVRRFDEDANATLAGTGLERVSGRSGTIIAIAKLFNTPRSQTITVEQLRLALCGEGTELEFERIDRALQSAWRAQMVMPVLKDDDDILLWARNAVCLLRDDLTVKILPILDTLSQLGESENLPTRALVQSYEEAFAQLTHVAENESKSPPRPVITVDAYAHTADRAHPPLPEGLVSALRSLTQAMPALGADTPSALMRDALCGFFDDRHPRITDGKEQLLPFLQAYFDAGGLTQTDFFRRTMDGDGSQIALDNEQANRISDEFVDGLASHALSGTDFTMPLSEFQQTSKEMADEDDIYLSLQYHLQPVGAGQAFVLNQIFPGACSTLTRFLPFKTITDQRAYLHETVDFATPLEVNAAFGFNASAHPKLIDRALSFPPFPEPSGREVISISDLWVERNTQTGALHLTSAQGSPYAPVYIAALNPMSLPKQFQALHTFCVNHWRHSGLANAIIQRAMESFDGFLHLSRIAIDRLVLLRRTWIVAADRLPSLSQSAADFYREFNQWADENDLPKHLFYQANVFSLNDPKTVGRGAINAAAPRLFKPMPLDRDCALGLNLFQQAARKLPSGVLLSEALPTPCDRSYHRESSPVAVELAVEITHRRRPDD